MNIIKLAVISLIAATSAFAETPQFEIEARYEGFDAAYFANVHALPGTVRGRLPEGVQAAPRITVKTGQTAVIEVTSEVVLPVTAEGKAPTTPRGTTPIVTIDKRGDTTIDGRKTANCGVSLEVSPEIRDGKIILSGKSTVRHLHKPETKQPLNAVSFATRETYFSDVVTDGQTVTIRVGDGPDDKAQITLKIKQIAPGAVPNA